VKIKLLKLGFSRGKLFKFFLFLINHEKKNLKEEKTHVILKKNISLEKISPPKIFFCKGLKQKKFNTTSVIKKRFSSVLNSFNSRKIVSKVFNKDFETKFLKRLPNFFQRRNQPKFSLSLSNKKNQSKLSPITSFSFPLRPTFFFKIIQ